MSNKDTTSPARRDQVQTDQNGIVGGNSRRLTLLFELQNLVEFLNILERYIEKALNDKCILPSRPPTSPEDSELRSKAIQREV